MTTIRDAEEILKYEYHRDNFLHIVKENLLPDYKRDEHDVKFKNNFFNKVTQLGESNICDLTVFEVELKEKVQKRRVAITQEMFKVLRGHRINNALVAFCNSDGLNYRISLLTSKYEFDGEKIIKIISNPRRYSYSLGYGTKTKIAYNFLIKKEPVNSLDELIGRFSIEVVNKQFYSEIAILFSELVGGERDGRRFSRQLELCGVTDQNKYAEFAVRMIGRTLYCWFLKEKKSEQGIPLISEDMLSLEATIDGENYYHNILEPLFFELLNKNHNQRRDKFGKEDKYKLVPYLNGGLFGPHIDDFYQYSPTLMCGTYGFVNIPNQWFDGLFSVLSQYNFTVDENTSYDIELSVDPEMLGRIFENLLAEINPDTGASAKKSTGSFYTPRDIVDFMVDGSLLEYLREKTSITDIKLKAVISYGKEDDEIATLDADEKKQIVDAIYTMTVLDPACGSGAFPIGMLQKVVYILQEVDPTANLWFDKVTEGVPIFVKKEFAKKFDSGSLDYIRKLSIIQNSIFGVDIQPIAVEISRLRCFLSLIIEEKVDDNEANRGVNPLPNLDFKFVIANTLFDLPNDAYSNSLLENSDHIDELSKIRSEYFNSNIDERFELINKFIALQNEMLDTSIKRFNTSASARYLALSSWKPFENEVASWFNPEWTFGIKNGFDIVIANPPYIDSETMVKNNQTYLREYITKNYKFAHGNWDIYIAFMEKGFSLLSNTGTLVYITPDKWISKSFGATLRTNLIANINTILVAGRDVFESALVDSIITFFTKKTKKMIELFDIKIKSRNIIYKGAVEKSKLEPPYVLDILLSDNIDFIHRLSSNNKKLSDYFSCENACATSDCYLLKDALYNLESFNDFDSEKQLKVINTGTIGRFVPKWGFAPMIYLKEKYDFPVVGIDTFKNKFANSYSAKTFRPKVIIKGLTLLDGCIDFTGHIVPGKSTLVVFENDYDKLCYLSAIINSKISIYYIKQKYSSSSYNGGINFNKDMIKSLPYAQKCGCFEKIVETVKEIINLKTTNPYEDTTKLENTINELLYKTYDLSTEEIAIIENSYSKNII